MDVFLGLALLVSLICLVLGARRARVQEVLAFLILMGSNFDFKINILINVWT